MWRDLTKCLQNLATGPVGIFSWLFGHLPCSDFDQVQDQSCQCASLLDLPNLLVRDPKIMINRRESAEIVTGHLWTIPIRSGLVRSHDHSFKPPILFEDLQLFYFLQPIFCSTENPTFCIDQFLCRSWHQRLVSRFKKSFRKVQDLVFTVLF